MYAGSLHRPRRWSAGRSATPRWPTTRSGRCRAWWTQAGSVDEVGRGVRHVAGGGGHLRPPGPPLHGHAALLAVQAQALPADRAGLGPASSSRPGTHPQERGDRFCCSRTNCARWESPVCAWTIWTRQSAGSHPRARAVNASETPDERSEPAALAVDRARHGRVSDRASRLDQPPCLRQSGRAIDARAGDLRGSSPTSRTACSTPTRTRDPPEITPHSRPALLRHESLRRGVQVKCPHAGHRP